MIDHICSYRHRLSQNLVENYLLDNLENEYKNYKVKCEKIEKEKEKQKKRLGKKPKPNVKAWLGKIDT